MYIALMSHDNKKDLMVQFCSAYAGILSRHNLCATNTTGRLVAAETGLAPEEIAAAETATGAVASLQSETVEGLTLESALGDEGIEGEIVESVSLRQAVAELPERERTVIALRYFRGLTQEKTARIVGVSQVQISRIERRAVEHLRKKLE